MAAEWITAYTHIPVYVLKPVKNNFLGALVKIRLEIRLQTDDINSETHIFLWNLITPHSCSRCNLASLRQKAHLRGSNTSTYLSLTRYIGPHVRNFRQLTSIIGNGTSTLFPDWRHFLLVGLPDYSNFTKDALSGISPPHPPLLLFPKGKKNNKKEPSSPQCHFFFNEWTREGQSIYQALLMSMLCFPQLCPGEYIFL